MPVDCDSVVVKDYCQIRIGSQLSWPLAAFQQWQLQELFPFNVIRHHVVVSDGKALVWYQFRRLADPVHSWSTYTTIETMVDAGRKLFPDVQDVYIHTLATSLAAWRAQGHIPLRQATHIPIRADSLETTPIPPPPQVTPPSTAPEPPADGNITLDRREGETPVAAPAAVFPIIDGSDTPTHVDTPPVPDSRVITDDDVDAFVDLLNLDAEGMDCTIPPTPPYIGSNFAEFNLSDSELQTWPEPPAELF